jgi:membrane fusion protein (multidrug efflux system)
VGDPVEITVAAFPDQTFRGSVLAIESSVRATTRTVQVRAQLPNPDLILRPGMFASVTLFRNTSRNAITVPRTAISYNTYGDFVFAINDTDEGQSVERVQVETGAVREGRVEVVDGLSEGQRIVANGLNRLRSGQPVRVTEDTETETETTGTR